MVRVQSGPPTQIPAPVAELSEIRARGRHVGQVQGDEDDLAFKLALAESANQQLREALKQNNEDMRRQLEAIALLRRRIETRQETYESQLLRMNGVIAELKKENQDVKNAKKKDKKATKAAEPAEEKKSQTPEKHKQSVQPAGDQNESQEARIVELESRGQVLKAETAKVNAEKATLAKELDFLRSENEKLVASNEKIGKEKWELAQSNADLSARLQQSMALTYMQGTSDSLLQEELHKLQVALSEERKVTERLSRSLELEKRKVESIEQKSRLPPETRQNLPEDLMRRDEQLACSMERYRMQCDNLAASLEECEAKLASFEIQEDYHVADLRMELASMKKLLQEEKNRSDSGSSRLMETQSKLSQVLKDYADATEELRQKEQKKREVRDTPSALELTDSLTAKAMHAEEQLRQERVRVKVLEEKVRQMELDVEAIPILKAQVEVYQADFNAERAAREKIAGEKSDLEEQVRRIQQRQAQLNHDIGALQDGRGELGIPPPIGLSSVRDRVNHLDGSENRERYGRKYL